MRKHTSFLKRALLPIVAVAFLFLSSGKDAKAQYCDFNYVQYWYQYAIIDGVWMDDLTEGNNSVWSRTNTGYEGYTLTDKPSSQIMKIGNDHRIRVYWGVYYRGYLRAYIDWNQDGRWENNRIGRTEEYLGRYYYYAGFTYPARPSRTQSIYADVECDIQQGETRLRLLASYYYGLNDACGLYYRVGYQWGYGEVEDYTVSFEPQTPNSYPGRGDILFNNQEYDGSSRMFNGEMTDFPKFKMEFTSPQPAGTEVKFRIVGPLPSTDVVYTAVDPISGSETITFSSSTQTYEIQDAIGSAALYGDGTFQASRGGEYRVVTEVAGAGCPGAAAQLFTVANNYDMSASEIVSPRTSRAPRFFKYKRGTFIAVTGVFQNVGLNAVSKFTAYATVHDLDGNEVYTDDFVYDADNNPELDPIQPGQKYEIDFARFRTFNVGEYTMSLDLDYELDEESYNNELNRPDDDEYYFEVQYNDQLEASQFLNPVEGQTIKENRPYNPRVEFKNLGIADASNVPLTLEVRNSANDVVYSDNIILEDIPQGRYNSRVASFATMVLDEPGTYTACAWSSYGFDEKRDDDTVCIAFNVEAGIEGIFTVGTLNESAAGYTVDRNFETIEEVMDALYAEGISGSVDFRFTDPSYTVTGDAGQPAWDMSARIIGVDEDNTIKFSAADNRKAIRGGVQINLETDMGMGIRFGQELFPSNEFAAARDFAEAEYVLSAGHITIDGGSQKAINLNLVTTNDNFGAVVYMQRGSNNISVKNVLMTNGSPQIANSTSLPNALYSQSTGFGFQTDEFLDQNSREISYSAGIVNRSTLIDPVTQIPTEIRDTLQNTNNLFENNEITGFGYGIVSLGIGPLFWEGDANNIPQYRSYYNQNNVIRGNRIWDVAATGIFLGFEENSHVTGNTVWDIDNSGPATGIQIGGNSRSNSLGYHNVMTEVSGNRVSGISSNSFATGIRVEQVRTAYEGSNGLPSYFPNVDENIVVTNNIVSGLDINSSSAARAGIHMLTSRSTDAVTPVYPGYYTSRDLVANNTVIIGNSSMSNTGLTAGIGIQNAQDGMVYNNAISVVDNNIDANTEVAATLFFQGNVEGNRMSIDRNAYWTGLMRDDLDNSDIGLFRYVMQNEDNEIVSAGTNKEYVNLTQIQAATNSNDNSVYGNFLNDMTTYQPDAYAPMMYKVKDDPTPLNSILNNRGENIAAVEMDIDGDLRGAAGQKYDIGADEFIGRLHVFDLAPVTILTPRAYRGIEGNFSDAQYIMTQAPIDLRVNLRNNGSIQQSGVEVHARIYRENATGGYDMANPIIDKTLLTDISSTSNSVVDFGLADGDADDWNPMSYTDLNNAGFTEYMNNIPGMFESMKANVTPLYKVVIEVNSDQENMNNTYEATYRFYLKKTPQSIVVSAVETMSDPINGTTEQTVGRLNYEAVEEGMDELGWMVDASNDVYDFDIFDRQSWEPRAVDYTMYTFLFWSEGYDTEMTREERNDIFAYLDAGSEILKRNLVMASEEAVMNEDNENLINRVLRAEYVSNDPLGNGDSYAGNNIVGDYIARDFKLGIIQPTVPGVTPAEFYANDVEPYPAVINVVNTDEVGRPLNGLSYPAFRFETDMDLVFGTTKIALTNNTVYTPVDWRNFGDIETMMRGVIDHFDKNGASVVPVELTEFNANTDNKSVVLDWTTASEYNTSMFTVERADVTEAGTGSFSATGIEMAAAGNNVGTRYYGPVTDYNVEYGNKYAYRLRTTDLDGTSSTSDVRIVEVGYDGGFVFDGLANNPTAVETAVEFTATKSGSVELSVYDVNGNKVMSRMVDAQEGFNSEVLNVSDLSSGAYTVVLRAENGTQTKQLRVER